MQPSYRDVAFLLSLGALPLACQDKDPTDDDTSTGGGPGPVTETPTTADDGTTDDGTTGDGTTGAPASTCQQYSDHLVECLPYYAMYADLLVTYCETSIAGGMTEYGPACAAALEAHYVCLNAVPCPDLEDETSDCVTESDNVETACPTLGEDPSESSSATMSDSGDTVADDEGTASATG